MRFEKLSKSHLQPLFEFELANRLWFESLIAPRHRSFYSEEGLYNHINEQIKGMKSGVSFNAVLVKDKTIVARGNLTEISKKEARVGYRVAEKFTSRGYANYCLTGLIQAALDLNINVVEAKVLNNNPASKHILVKQGFKKIRTIPNFLILNNQKLDCTVLQKICR